MEDKNLVCKNFECPNNSNYKKEKKDNEICGFCNVFTERDLMNRTSCEERIW